MKRITYIFLAICILIMSGCSSLAEVTRDERWAVPVVGADNMYKVSDRLYRSAQPDALGMKNIEELGIKTVISLRSGQKDIELAKRTNLKLIHVSMRAWNPQYNDAVTVMRLLNESTAPILIHCYHGADRTGMMVALYRMVYEDWNREDALDEMLNGGYGYHSMWKDIVTFIKEVDIEQLKKDTFRK